MNKVQVDLDEVGRIHLSRAGYGNGIYTLETTEALRAFFQAERDEQLGWWRDPENPNTVVYPRSEQDDHDGRCVWLLDEHSGEFWPDWEHTASPGPARRYFETHPQPEPKPKPWEAAKPGEVWLVTLRHCEPQICQVLKTHKFLPTQTDTGGQPPALPLDHPTIITAHKIWPEPRIGGTE